MKHLLLLVFALAASAVTADAEKPGKVLFDFAEPAAMRGWQIEDDGVMGGVSKGTFTRAPEGHAVFSGKVSLDNNGGFSSV